MAEQLRLDLRNLYKGDLRLLSVSDIYSNIENIDTVELREDRRIERKSAGIAARALADYLCIFANTPSEGGLILVGVEDDGSISGCRRISPDHLNSLERCGDVYCTHADYECKTIPTVNRKNHEDFILVFWVKYSRNRLVETSEGSAFIRRGSSKRKLRPDEMRELQDVRGQVEAESEDVKLSWPDNFRLNAISQFVSTVRDARSLSYKLKVEEVLELRHLGRRHKGVFIPNLACALIFAKDVEAIIPGARIRFFRFAGTVEKTGENYNVIKDITIEGTVPELIVNGAEVIDGQVREFSRLGKDQLFYSVPEYPRSAWYEALVNACVHRSYILKNMNIFVKMFDDRIVIESPGGFPPFVTPENIYDMHQPRNPHLMDAMFYMKFVQAAHEGTRRIRDTMQQLGLPEPVFTQKEIGAPLVQVILKNDIEHRKAFVDTDAFRALGEPIAKNLNEYERRIVNFVVENRTINVTQAKDSIGRRWHYTKKLLTSLAERGILDHVHSDSIERDSFAYYTLPKRLSDKIRRGR